jgi:hypothetical protein
MRVTRPIVATSLGDCPVESRLQARVALYQPRWRRQIADLARSGAALADLAESHPALLFALASGFGDQTSRELTIDALQRGVPLDMAACLYGLPRWLRKLPAGALCDPLPRFEMDQDFSRRMANLIPPDSSQATLWLRAVIEAQIAGGRAYALWVARHGVALTGTLSDTRRQMLHAWVWMGHNPGEVGHSLIRRPWSPDCGIKRVMDEFVAWMHRVALAEWLGTGRLMPWVPDAEVQGYQFHTLRTADEYVRAALALDNCLEQYADRLRLGSSVVVLISYGGEAVACLELEPHDAEMRLPSIKQLRGFKNRRVTAAIWQAVYAWLGRAPLTPLPHPTSDVRLADRAHMRERLWATYLATLAAAEGGASMEPRARNALGETAPVAGLAGAWPRLRRADQWRDMRDELMPRTSLIDRIAHLLPRATGRG